VRFKDNPIRDKPTKLNNNNPWWVAFKKECVEYVGSNIT